MRQSVVQKWQRRAKNALSAQALLWRTYRRAGDERTECRFRRRQYATQRAASGGSLCIERQQDVDYQWPGCRHLYYLCQNRPLCGVQGDYCIDCRARYSGIFAQPKARQTRHARLQYVRVGFSGLPGAGRQCPRRRGAWRGGADVGSRLRAHGTFRWAGRHHASLPRHGLTLRASAPAIWPSDWRVSVDAG